MRSSSRWGQTGPPLRRKPCQKVTVGQDVYFPSELFPSSMPRQCPQVEAGPRQPVRKMDQRSRATAAPSNNGSSTFAQAS